MNMVLLDNLAASLRGLRGEQSLRGYAAFLGVDSSALQRMERGEENITLATLQKIRNATGMSVGTLFKDP